MEHSYKGIVEISKEVKQKLTKAYPQCKWSVSKESFSGGRSLTVALMAAPFKAFASDKDINGNPIKGYAQLNQYQFRDGYNSQINNGSYLTQEAWNTMSNAYKIANNDNWDNSDIQTDYFDVNYWLHLEIGKWDKPYQEIN